MENNSKNWNIMEDQNNYQPIFDKLDKVTKSTSKKIKWIVLLTFLILPIHLVLHVIYKYDDIIFIVTSALFVMLMVFIVFLILNRSVDKKMEIIKNLKK